MGGGGIGRVGWGGGVQVGQFGVVGHEATDTGLAYAPVSQAHGHHHTVQCFALLVKQRNPMQVRFVKARL